MASNDSLYEKIYEIVKMIPAGKVASYGQIARIVGCDARRVGYALSSLRQNDVPWQRVINSKGQISLGNDGWGSVQRQMLEAEGIEFDESGKVDFKKVGWSGPGFGLFGL